MFELALVCREADVETVSDALMEIDALAVSVEDADADTEAEHALFGEPGMPAPKAGWERSVVKALFPGEPEATEAATLILAQDWAADVHVQAIQAVPEQDWVRLTQSQFAPVEITPEFWIVPSWHEAPPQARRVMRLDPGLAFGTGTHPTTRMCLRWIAKNAQEWPRVLDYGCGSGILAIGAALHGAQDIDAVDIDPAAVTSSRDNAAANGVTLKPGLPELARGEYPLVIANILATPLKLLAPLLSAHVAPGGRLILAGILERQAAELKAAYAPWLALDVGDEEDGWILMTAQRAA
ncbi:50S ribosomal protein L11 methyltransferase [Pelomonas aquatica]|uniref:Ribosomal protein L11 methyltransferase n=1 Tax=Pelomonas aquatica TaxID=431058 RepID=A0A9X4LGS9_9BURK|nr:50S ribosomal protein L11 methyltransferase [Pelomonas aquatica]MCY4754165.1 50S ribosomal protein L11 methyltransferase [Pelomonas aquatica]MDG0862464.1 50S ribosomal protein L11 methyltransferase [Pelomonas aquatica]